MLLITASEYHQSVIGATKPTDPLPTCRPTSQATTNAESNCQFATTNKSTPSCLCWPSLPSPSY